LDGILLSSSIDDANKLVFANMPSDLSEGEHTIDFRLTDAAGNESDPFSMKIVFDRTPPKITSIMPLDGFLTNVADQILTIRVNDASPVIVNVNGTDITGNGLEPSPTLQTSINLTEGTNKFKITVTDQGGLKTVKKIYYTLDTIAPTIVLTSPANNTWDTDGNVQMSYTLTDTNPNTCQLYRNISGVWGINQSDATPISGLNSFNATAVRDGNFIWNVFCNDSAGFSD
ncbi:MAG: Ig-like domain repeat protein, partial [Bacteroidota bacterium]